MFLDITSAPHYVILNEWFVNEESLQPHSLSLDVGVQTDVMEILKGFVITNIENVEVSKKSTVRSKAVQHRPIVWDTKDAACSPWRVTPITGSNQSSLKSTPESFHVTSTPNSAKRKATEEDEIDQLELSISNRNRMKKRKCVRSLALQELSPVISTPISSAKQSLDLTWRESSSYSSTTSSIELSNLPHSTSNFNVKSRQRVLQLIKRFPKTYLGINSEWVSVLSLISSKFKAKGGLNSLAIVYLVVRKICLNESFHILGHEFGISKSTAANFFRRYLPFIADYVKDLICLPKF